MKRWFTLLLLLFLASQILYGQAVDNSGIEVCFSQYCETDTISKQELRKSLSLITKTVGWSILQFTYSLDCNGCHNYTKTVNSDTLFDPDMAKRSFHKYSLLIIENIVAKNKHNQILRLKAKVYYIRP
jgi:hypothetical protein